ncbi:MAG TPA: NAD(P)H-dependent oxidoreductase [Chlamydiales bacterium]|nr:NAD(P)H-dependent oxidoreductase [Chlamydiales bacterium]
MKRLLHIIASPREEESRTLQVSEVFLEAFKEKHPDWVIDELDLAKETLPDLGVKSVSGKYVLLGGKDLFGRLKESWAEIVQHIERFKTADLFLISTPMWNFSIPYMLKHYIDLIVQPRYLFRYTDSGKTEGLVKGRKMVVIVSRGGQYTGDMQGFDFQEPYLKTIFGFVGITDIAFITAEPMDMGIEIQKKKIAEAQKEAKLLARKL